MKEDLAAPRPTLDAIDRLRHHLRLTTPIIALYDCEPSPAFEPVVVVRQTDCCFSYYARWEAGHTLVVKRDGPGCPGAHRAFGLRNSNPGFMAHFLTDGEGAPAGEGLRSAPEVAQALLDATKPVENRSGYVLLGPLRLDEWEAVRSVTFVADPDRLSGLTTLAGYWSSRKDVVVAPFGSACSSMLRALEEYEDEEPAVIGGMDIAMRQHLPDALMTLTVSPSRFAKMLTFPDGSFPFKPWWNDLMGARKS